MISLEEYKIFLVNYCKYNIDRSYVQIKIRQEYLNKYYGDEYLKKIITDTYEFIIQIFESNTIDSGYCSFNTEEDNTTGINLNITGGGFTDTLYIYQNEKLISEYILKQTFGKYFQIYIKNEMVPFETGDDILSFDFKYLLYMQGFPKNIKEIKENLLGKEKILSK